jgi:succinoglycan biosynthesis protein ExoV
VRGPRSAAALGLPAAAGVVDPSVLLPELALFAGLGRGEERLFVPHHSSMGRLDWHAVCEGTGLVPVDPCGDAHEIIRRIAAARSVIAESMHAAIIADAFRVPWQGVAISAAFNDFKWQDWGESLGMEIGITRFFSGLRGLQAFARRLAPARRPAASLAGAAPVAAVRAPEPPAGPFAPALAAIARRTLRRVDGQGYRLSAREALDAKKRSLAAILEAVRRDYG